MSKWVDKYKVYYDSFTVSEKKVANYFIENSEKIGECTLRSLSNEIGVGQQTIIRAIKVAGYNSWKVFQREIWQETSSEKRISEEVGKKDNIYNAPLRIVEDDIAMVVSMAQNLDIKELYKVVKLLKKAKIIDVYGTENSSNAAAELTGKLLHLGFTCRNYSDLFLQKISAGHLGFKDIAIAFSISGETKAVVEALNAAKVSNATVIAVTGNRDSSLAKIADYIFLTPTIHMNEVSKWISSRITQIAFVDALCAAILVSDSERFSEELVRSSKEFQEYMISK